MPAPRFHHCFAAICTALLITAAPAAASELCDVLAGKLANLDLAKSEELVASQAHTTYKKLYAECDSGDAFNGKSLPMFDGRPLRCSTDRNRATHIRKFPDGTIVFQAKMSVDADGSLASRGPNASATDQAQTWPTFDQGSADHFVNAEEVSFVVVPQASERFRTNFRGDTGIGKGDLAIIMKGSRCSLGVVGDTGPSFRIGEGSIKAHEDLGNPQCKVAGQHPCQKLKAGGSGVGIGGEVT